MRTIARRIRQSCALALLFTILASGCGGNPTEPGTAQRECEDPDKATVGQLVSRTNASGSRVHGQFGTTGNDPWPPESGLVQYDNLDIPQTGSLYLELRYSKHSPSTVPILIYLDDETAPKAKLYPVDQGDWNRFTWTEPLLLGNVEAGIHSVRFFTTGQQYGVADLDVFVLTIKPPPPTSTPTVLATATATTPEPVQPGAPVPISSGRSLAIVVDDFEPQPYQGEAVFFYNRLEGDRGALNDSVLDWGDGQVTITLSPGRSWGGVWMSLNHPIREDLPIDFSAVLPVQVLPAYQSQITGITVEIARATADRTSRIELRDWSELRWKKEITLGGDHQFLSSDLPVLREVNHLVLVLDPAAAGDSVVLEGVSLTATTQVTDTATAAFVWSYGMLLANWNPATGLVRDKAKDPSGEFDAIQATGSLAAATALAAQLGVVARPDATEIVTLIGDTLLLDLPRYHGLWPHWVRVAPSGALTILENTEWSSVDTAIAAIGLLEAQSSLGMDTSRTEQMLQDIDWEDLVMPDGISHGYSYSGDRLPWAWDIFGGESWLVDLAYAAATGQVGPISEPLPPTYNGSGFIDELAWLFVPPPSGQDNWGADWTSYRFSAAEAQVGYYPAHEPGSCLAQLGLFGLSAAEVPALSSVPQRSIYQSLGVGGRFVSAEDGSDTFGAPVVVPHYAATVASLRPEEALTMWDWLIESGVFSPLTNVESLAFPATVSCDPDSMVWNHMKGSWNLALQTLGWGRYLAERGGEVPILWQAAEENPLLHRGYLLIGSE